MQSTPPRYNQQMVAAEVRTSAQRAVSYVTGGVVVRPSTLKPPDISTSYKNSGYEPAQVERVGCTSISSPKALNEQSLGAWEERGDNISHAAPAALVHRIITIAYRKTVKKICEF